jgi:hypothetical protein
MLYIQQTRQHQIDYLEWHVGQKRQPTLSADTDPIQEGEELVGYMRQFFPQDCSWNSAQV